MHFLGYGPNRLTLRDRLLLTALKAYEQTVSSEHGMSLLLTTDPHYAGHFRIKPENPDLAAETWERWHERREKTKAKREPGERFGLDFKFDLPDGR